jgi:hypothetical protein
MATTLDQAVLITCRGCTINSKIKCGRGLVACNSFTQCFQWFHMFYLCFHICFAQCFILKYVLLKVLFSCMFYLLFHFHICFTSCFISTALTYNGVEYQGITTKRSWSDQRAACHKIGVGWGLVTVATVSDFNGLRDNVIRQLSTCNIFFSTDIPWRK